ncbi:DUF3131 domain-containing protein [Vibrio sp. 404]|uniref:DUF3131 domain-containing protein n=1 Tax=Vibrio marinisediminis TaxID=2758441 RepID=A0A7W2FML5_9VIBR|nr:DUF3131 domain-containing protein [Vibrio marinisediminis]MBA5760804.1 DUF3131 domain-containing protein [Vibrio marinisediminis]
MARYLAGLIIAGLHISLPISSMASDDSQDESISFYGQRSLAQPTTEKPKATLFHRRVIAPPIQTAADSQAHNDTHNNIALTNESEPIYQLTRNERLLAKKAQYYFERNRRQTGLWDSVQGYPHTTMWDIASGIAATLALEALELKEPEQAHRELKQTLNTLQAMPLYKDWLPNREYSTKTAQPSGRLSKADTNGNGWSALDIGRLLIWLKIMTQQHPEFEKEITHLLDTWQLKRAINGGTLYGANFYKGQEYYRQEGRHGYLQYAATGFELFNYSLPLPKLNQYLKSVEVSGTELLVDTRNVPFLTSDPYVLASLETGQEGDWNQINTIYALHKFRSKEKGKLFSYAEDAMNKNPWFAYNNLYYYGKPWTSVSPSGKVIENPQIFSHKIAFGFSVLFNDEFSQELATTVLNNSLHTRSIPTGQYENGGANTAFNINTNSLVLVALWYKSNGSKPIYRSQKRSQQHSTQQNID